MDATNPCGLRGLDFVEWTSPDPAALQRLFATLGFSALRRHATEPVTVFRQGDITFLINEMEAGFAASFRAQHGPSLCAMGWRVDDAAVAHAAAIARGARAYDGPPLVIPGPAIYGIGDSVIVFVDAWGAGGLVDQVTRPLAAPVCVPSKGFTVIDHLTNNVPKGGLAVWSDFYRRVFGFTEVRHFDIRGEHTGLVSYALRSPDGSFCIPINEGNEAKSQIEEYLREYRGPGVQHLALLTDDLLGSLDQLAGGGVEMLDIDAAYYEDVFDRVPGVAEDHARIAAHQVLVDGDEHGYLLQIFTRNVVGPIFFELIQRRNHLSFGEGNFGALFRSIERDQERRGAL